MLETEQQSAQVLAQNFPSPNANKTADHHCTFQKVQTPKSLKRKATPKAARIKPETLQHLAHIISKSPRIIEDIYGFITFSFV